MKKPFLIIIDGPMGSGKTTISLELYKKMKNTAIINLDKLKHIYSDFKPGNPQQLQLASNIGKVMAKEYLRNRINVIAEKSFVKEEFVKSFIKGLDKHAKIFVYQLNAPLETRIKRIRKKESLKPESRKQSLTKIKRNTQHFEEKRYQKAKIFESHKLNPKKIVNEILKDIK